ncbi:MAG: DNA mismatch repair protein MutS [archaeon]
MENLTPAMRQYMEVKSQNKDCLVLFRMGDFYETFFDDAKVVARELEITLTKRGMKNNIPIPLAGVPYHAIDTYLGRLVKKGYKVAIVEQLENPKFAKGVVKRGLVRIVTPGTIIENNMLSASNNYICAISVSENKYGISFLDISTGEFICTQLDSFDEAINELQKKAPSETIVPSSFESTDEYKRIQTACSFANIYPEVNFFIKPAQEILAAHFQEEYNASGIANKESCISSSGALLSYVKDTQKNSLSYINKLRYYSSSEYMLLDNSTIKNLEIFKSNDSTGKQSLFDTLNKTATTMGARLLRSYLLAPLLDIKKITKRLDSVEELSKNAILMQDLTENLKEVNDIERIISRINYGNATPRDLIGLKLTICVIPKIKEFLKNTKSDLLMQLSKLEELSEISGLIEKSIVDEPPAITSDGNFIKKGYNENLDELFDISRNAKTYIRNIENQEKEKTQIKSLKIKFNKIFGYFIEITNTNKASIPENYIKKQTLVNCERYITEELKEKESIILGSEEKIIALEQQIFSEVVTEIAKYTCAIQDNAKKLAVIDVLNSFAIVAQNYNYAKPIVKEGYSLEIIEGRHPVLENLTDFVPNNLIMDKSNRTWIITGPNMAGKSVFMRQAALIIIMAQAGSFVPAKRCVIGLVDRIFTRVGASDDMSRGQSTFSLEMSETAQILNNATENSFIVLDEIGRGTSTFDGIAIAWAVAEHINNNIKAKTLFATHYHSLNELSSKLEGVKNYNIAVREEEGDVIFLRKIVEGGTDKSYGIHVAKLSGIPKNVITRAKEIQFMLESEDTISEKIIVEKKIEKKEKNEKITYSKTMQTSLSDLT